MSVQELGAKLEDIVVRIRTTKSELSKVHFEYNIHYFRSYGITGCYGEINHLYKMYLSFVKESDSLQEFREKVYEDCKKEGHKLFVSNGPSCSSCDAGYYYHNHGGDSLYFAYVLKNKIRKLKKELSEEEREYKSNLRVLKEITD